jgi:hypothetical protein
VRRSTAAFGRGSRGYLLDHVPALRATIAPLEPGYVHVALTADMRKRRSAFVGGAAAAVTTGLAGAAVLLVLQAFPLIALAPIIAGAAAGVGIVRQYPPRLERIQLGLERALDALQKGIAQDRPAISGPRGGISSLIADEIRKALK